MSDLRDHVVKSRSGYESFAYPGNLLADVRRIRAARRNRIIGMIAGVSGLAAAITLLIITNWPRGSDSVVIPDRPSMAFVIVPVEKFTLELPAIPAMPDGFSVVPSEGFSIVPEYQPMVLPALPSFSSEAAEPKQDGPTTQESV